MRTEADETQARIADGQRERDAPVIEDVGLHHATPGVDQQPQKVV
jgi:hypothetical protein